MNLVSLLSEYKLAIRDSKETDDNCYAALNSVKDEAITKIVNYLKASALNSAPSEHTITLTTAYRYSVSTASPAIGHIIEVNTNNGLGSIYRPMERVEAPWYSGMLYNYRFPQYRFYGSSFDLRSEPVAGCSVIISYLGSVSDVSGSWISTTSGLTDEAQKMWAWYAAARYFEANQDYDEAGAKYKVFNQKLYGTQRGF